MIILQALGLRNQYQMEVTFRARVIVRNDLFCCQACSLRLYGSTLTQFAFKTSDINIDVTHPSSVSLLLWCVDETLTPSADPLGYFVCSDDTT